MENVEKIPWRNGHRYLAFPPDGSYIEKDYELHRLTTKTKSLIIKDFNLYVKYGGFPLVVKEQDLELINSYFQDILS